MAELNAKILVWGLNHSGKTTNLRMIHNKLRADHRGELQTFEMGNIPYQVLPIELGEVQGFTTRLKLYALPGNLDASLTRESLSQDAVGVVLIVDSQTSKIAENVLLYEEMVLLLEQSGTDLQGFPVVVQYNKFDLPTAAPIDELEEKINTRKYPFFKAVAKEGTGVLPTLTTVSKGVIRYLKQKGSAIRTKGSYGADLSVSQQPSVPPTDVPLTNTSVLAIRKMSVASGPAVLTQDLVLQLTEPSSGRLFNARMKLRAECTPEGFMITVSPEKLV